MLTDFYHRCGGSLIRATDPDDIGARFRDPLDLLKRRFRVSRICIGHGLNCYWRVPANRHIAHHDLPTFTSFDIAPGTYAHADLRQINIKES